MHRKSRLIFTILILLILIGCEKKWQNPNTSVPALEKTIGDILQSPNAYDSAGVIVEGMVWDLKYDIYTDDEIEIPFTSFKLADADGNYINVYAEGNYPIVSGEQIRVLGIYRVVYLTKSRNFENEIEALQIKLETTSTLYRLYRYLR